MPNVRVSYPRFRREGEPPHLQITADDVRVLRTVFQHRFVRSDDLYRLLETRSPDRLSRRLTTLFRAGYLDRPPAQINRFTAGGSQSFVYGLGATGARYLKETLGASVGATDWRSRNRTYTRENLDHTLSVTRFMIDVELACRARPDVVLIPFEDILANAPRTTQTSRNPMSWPVPIQWHGARPIVHLAPDAIFGMRKTIDGKARRAHFFVEVDRGTMTILPSAHAQESEAFPYRATILRKLLAYADSFRLGLHKEVFGVGPPRIVIVTPGQKRASNIREVVRTVIVQKMNLPPGMFGVWEYGDLNSLWEEILIV